MGMAKTTTADVLHVIRNIAIIVGKMDITKMNVVIRTKIHAANVRSSDISQKIAGAKMERNTPTKAKRERRIKGKRKVIMQKPMMIKMCKQIMLKCKVPSLERERI